MTGRVIDQSDGRPIPGVNVLIQGTTTGTTTDSTGAYALQAAPADTLVFSFVGYRTQRVSVQGRSTIDVTLAPASMQLDDLVVTALGIEREERALGYAVQEVDGSQLEKAIEPNVMGSLTGEVAGLVVYNKTGLFETPEFTLRGQEPLIVIDGVPYENMDFWNLSASDVKNVSVLKGTAASALYGSRGKDGAVMITTKDGAGASEGFSVSYDNSTMFQAGFAAIPETQDEYGTGYAGRYRFVDGQRLAGNCSVQQSHRPGNGKAHPDPLAFARRR